MNGPMILKAGLVILVGYLLVCLTVFLLQRRMLYFPTSQRLSENTATQMGLTFWPSPDDFQGLLYENAASTGNGTVIVFHGNAGAAWDRLFYAKALSRLNFRVILAEYPGYGGRKGRPSENLLVADAVKTIQLAKKTFQGPLYAWGESLGCGVVAAAAAETENLLDGLVLFLPWDSLPSVAKTHYGYLPVNWLIKDQYDSIENLKAFTANTAVLLAGKDEIIPVKHGHRLFDALTMNKRIWVFDQATHNTMPVDPQLVWWKEVMDFLSDRAGS